MPAAPILPRASAAVSETRSSSFPSHSASAGIAAFAGGPMFPRAEAAAIRTSWSLSLSNSVRAGTAGGPIFSRTEACSVASHYPCSKRSTSAGMAALASGPISFRAALTVQ